MDQDQFTITLPTPIKTRYGEIHTLKLGTYEHGNLAVLCLARNGEPQGKLSVNVSKVIHTLTKYEFLVKTYSENEGLMELFLDAGYLIRSKGTIQNYEGVFPICSLAPHIASKELLDKLIRTNQTEELGHA